MINEYFVKTYCKDDISLIENYKKAVNDKKHTWHCHHRRENISSRKDLIKRGEYYNRPSEELIFLTKSEHMALHSKGVLNSEEAIKKRASSLKGKKPWLGKRHSKESKLKISTAMKAIHWFNNGIINTRAKSCPEGFVRGRLKQKSV